MTTASRAKIEASLAERGRPLVWANEQESAVMSGFPADGAKFREALPEMEKEGFPRIDPRNNKRFVPAILNYWAKRVDVLAAAVPESAPKDIRSYEDSHEGQRKAS